MITSIDLYDKEFVRLASQFMNPSYVIGADFRDRKLRFETMELSKRVQTKCFLTFPQTLVPYYLARAMTMEWRVPSMSTRKTLDDAPLPLDKLDYIFFNL